MANKELSWEKLEGNLATAVIRQARERTKHWKIACVIATAALIYTNIAWLRSAGKERGE